MVGTMTRLQSGVRGNTVSVPANYWIPSTVRCRCCGSLSRIEVQESLTGGETMVRYECGACQAVQTRHYFDTDLGAK